MHEVVTIQLGQQSNYLGTHFWNAQESYFTYAQGEESPVDHDVLWRPGIGADGSETYTPRTLIYDLKGGFGTLRKLNALYAVEDEAPPQALWAGNTIIQTLDPIPQHSYQQSLDTGLTPPNLTTSSVRYWSDFNRVFYHPRSVIQLNDYTLNSSLSPFEQWSTGEDLFAQLDKEHDLLDRDVRPFMEEADHAQGIQMFTGLDDAWGGFAGRYAERLRDEYGKMAIWIWGLQNVDHGRVSSREKRMLGMANRARSLGELYKHASMVVPLGLPKNLRHAQGLDVDTGSLWHTTALLSAAVETVTLPDRLKERTSRATLDAIGTLLNVHGRQTVSGLQMSFAKGGTTPDCEQAGDEPTDGVALDMDLSPWESFNRDRMQNGYHTNKLFGQMLSKRGGSTEKDTDIEEAYEQDRRRPHEETRSQTFMSSVQYPLPDSFPKIFHDRKGEPLVHGVAITASLSTGSSLSRHIKQMRSDVVRMFGVEDRETLGNDLAEMADEYHEGWSSGSDDGDDL